MTLTYKLFGIPKTFDEFVDKAKRQGSKHIRIILEAYDNIDGFGGLFTYNVAVGLKAGKTVLKLKEHTHMRMGVLLYTVLEKNEIEKQGLEDAVELYEKLTALGFESSVNKKPINEILEAIKAYKQNIKEFKRKYDMN